MKHPSNMPTPRFELGGSDLWSLITGNATTACNRKILVTTLQVIVRDEPLFPLHGKEL